MISTVTTSTVSTITSAAGVAASLGLIAVLALVGMLVVREMTAGHERPRMQALARALNVAIVPLLIAFAVIVAARVVQAL